MPLHDFFCPSGAGKDYRGKLKGLIGNCVAVESGYHRRSRQQVQRSIAEMRCRKTSVAEDLMTAPWWVNVAVCAIGNVVIWLVVPGYFEARGPGDLPIAALTAGYAGAQSLLSKLFNLAMALIFTFSIFYNSVLKK